MTVTKPYRPAITLDQVRAFDPAVPETHTPSLLVNAVAEALHETKSIEACEIAEYLEVDRVKLSHAIYLETGMTLIELVQNYRLLEIRKFIGEHPDMKLDEVAHACGYASDGSLWRFFQRKFGQTARGEKSNAGPERFNERLKELHKRYRGL